MSGKFHLSFYHTLLKYQQKEAEGRDGGQKLSPGMQENARNARKCTLAEYQLKEDMLDKNQVQEGCLQGSPSW